MLLGTARRASIVMRMTIGSTRTASVKPPEMKLRPKVSGPVTARMAWTKTTSPRMPYTIDGTPARFRMFVVRSRFIRVSRAYSCR